MAQASLAANSYGSLAEVEALARHLLDGEIRFNDSTKPTDEQVVALMDRISGVLNMALRAEGMSFPLTDNDAVLACDQFVVDQTTRELRYTYPHYGITGRAEEASVPDLYKDAKEFAETFALAFKAVGETVSEASSEGLAFTGLLKHSERADPDNTSYEQPKFRRGMFDA